MQMQSKLAFLSVNSIKAREMNLEFIFPWQLRNKKLFPCFFL